jgi:hypothetical protein
VHVSFRALRNIGLAECVSWYCWFCETLIWEAKVNALEVLDFIKQHGIVLQAGHGPVPNLAETIAGEPIRGSWWGHPRGREIFHTIQTISESPEVLVCKLIEGKVTFIHRRLWPALVKLASHFPKEQLSQIREEHTPSGAHILRRRPFPTWVPGEVVDEAKALSLAEAEKTLAQSLPSLVLHKTRSRPRR